MKGTKHSFDSDETIKYISEFITGKITMETEKVLAKPTLYVIDRYDNNYFSL